MENRPTGLTSDEARRRLSQFGHNATPNVTAHPLRLVMSKFLAPVSVLLEIAIVLQLVLGEYIEASIIGLLLIFNAAIGFFHESRAQSTIAALKSRLALNASVFRDGAWTTLPAAELVPGDIAKLTLGTVVVADVHILSGSLLLDCLGPARRGDCGDRRNRGAHEVWAHRGTRPHRLCRQHAAEGRVSRLT